MKWIGLNISKRLCIISLWFVLLATGCKKLIHVDEPDDSLTTSAVFSNDSLAQAAVTGLYLKVMGSSSFLLNGAMSLYPGLSADEFIRTNPSINEDPFANNLIFSDNQIIYINLWKAAYNYIYQCNISVEGLTKSNGVSRALKQQLLGEVLFMRALCYYYLVNLFGEVPLVLGTNADVNTMLFQAPVRQVYKQVEADLTVAYDMLLTNTPNTKPTKFAVQALMARVYLFTEKWDKAEEMASNVINSGQFLLVDELSNVFKINSNETILQLAPVADRMNAAEGFIFVPAPSALPRPNYMLTDSLWNAFEPGDLRKGKWVNTVTVGGKVYNYPYKYRVYMNSIVSERNVVLRLAEQYLIRAEARVHLSRTDDAVIDLNKIRIRAGLPAFSSTIGSEECLQKIEQERRIELFAEWGHRWFDLKRTNRANAVLKTKVNWKTEDQLYPIPQTELEFAPNLVQNPGY